MADSRGAAKFTYDAGTRVRCRGYDWVIQSQIPPDKLSLERCDGNDTLVVKSFEVEPATPTEAARPISAIPEEDYETAKARYELLKPILKGSFEDRSRLVKEAARLASRSIQTIYAWIRRYEATGTTSSLAPKRKGSQRGSRRISKKVEAIIEAVIASEYLHKQRRTIKSVYEMIKMTCADAGIDRPPSLDTVRRRIRALPQDEVAAKRHGAKFARDNFDVKPGKFRDGERPLQTVQIDHTRLDIKLVNRQNRELTKRPHLTIAVDVYSGMVTGLHLSYEPPSVTSVGMCLYRSAIHKEPYLREIDVDGEWPVWGLPTAIHVDNAMEFRSNSLRDGCAEYGIDLQFRPVKLPEYGGHVERTFRSLNSIVHDLPGTTRSNVQDKGDYKSEKEALLTIDELEQILVGFIVNDFHINPRKEDGASRLDRWKQGIAKKGQFERIPDKEKFFIDFLPQKDNATVQTDGITWDYIQYYDVKLKKWKGSGRRLKVKRDPRDVSKIYVLNPDSGEYFKVERANDTVGRVSLAEHKAVLDELRSRNEPLTQNRQFAELRRRRDIEANARQEKRSKKSRRHKADQQARNRRELSEVHESSNPQKAQDLTVIEGGLPSVPPPDKPPVKRGYKIRPRDGQKRYEDW